MYFHHYNAHNDSKEHFLLFYYCYNEVQWSKGLLVITQKSKYTPRGDLQLQLLLKVQHTGWLENQALGSKFICPFQFQSTLHKSEL